MRWILRVGVLVAAVVVGRELHVRQTEITTVAGEVDRGRVAITETEDRLDALDREIDEKEARLRSLDAEIDAIERRHPHGIPRSEYAAYKRLVDERNSVVGRRNVLVEQHRALVAGYGRTVDRYNAGVQEIHTLARRGTPTAAAKDLWNDFVDAWTDD